MKKKILAGFASGLILIGTTGIAHALTIVGGDLDGTDVGGIDTIFTSDVLGNSGDAGEVAWVNSLLSTSYTTADLIKVEAEDAGWVWYDTTDQNTFAYDLQLDGTTFFIKTGNYTFNENVTKDDKDLLDATLSDHFLYLNELSTDWAVVSLIDIGEILSQEISALYIDGKISQEYTLKSSQLNLGKLSHIGEVGTAPVPEPATMLLFGTGLAGLAGFARKKYKA